jgi:hypothetical protein
LFLAWNVQYPRRATIRKDILGVDATALPQPKLLFPQSVGTGVAD